MIKVKIVKDGVKGADDGATVRSYAKGVIYTVSDALGEVFIEAAEGVEVVEEKQSVTDKLKAKAAKTTVKVDVVAPVVPEPVAVTPEPEPTAPEAVTGLPGLPGLPKASGK